MPIWIAIGGVVVGVLSHGDHSDYSDYSDHSDYSDYSNYSDAAVRRQRRLDAAKAEFETAKSQLSSVKSSELNPILREVDSKYYISKNAYDCEPDAMDSVICKMIDDNKNQEILSQTKDLNSEIASIDRALNELDSIQSTLEKQYGKGGKS